MDISVEKFLDALPIVGKGMLGIFIVTAIIIVVVSLLNRFTAEKDGK